MADEEDLDNQPDEEEQPQPESGVIRDLRRQLKAAKKEAEDKGRLEQEIAEMRRTTAMREAVAGLGVTDEAKFAKLADKFIAGEPNENDLRALAEEYGFLAVEPQAPNAAEAQQMQQAQQSHVSGQVPLVNSPGDYQKRLAEAKNPEEVLKISEEAGILKPVQ